MVARRKAGLLFDHEIVEAFLVCAADAQERSEIETAFSRLPIDIQALIRARLNQLAAERYQLRPFFIPGPPSDQYVAYLSVRLRSLHEHIARLL
jgi:hypothetical protein